MSAKGRLVVISGPTASGKSTLWNHLVRRPEVEFSVSATTRKPRAGEKDGREYHFVEESQFLQWIEEGAFLEWAQVHGHYYGTLRSEVEACFARGHDVILEIDVQGVKQLQGCGLPLITIFLLPPSMDILEQRLRARGTETEEQMRQRLEVAEQEIESAKEYMHQVVNDDFARMEAEVERILGYQMEKA